MLSRWEAAQLSERGGQEMGASVTGGGVGETLEEICNLAVGVYADHMGRGPTKARAYMHEDLIVCLMEDTMTTSERTLIRSGQAENVLAARRAVQEGMRAELVLGIEKLSGRAVIAYTSAS